MPLNQQYVLLLDATMHQLSTRVWHDQISLVLATMLSHYLAACYIDSGVLTTGHSTAAQTCQKPCQAEALLF